MKAHLLRCVRGGLLSLTLGASAVMSADLDDSRAVVSSTNREAAASQQRIDALAVESQQLLEEYRQLAENADYQAAYSRELELLHQAQQEQIAELERDIARAQVTRQRILPLMRSMVEALEQFVVLDLPFRQEERVAAVVQLRQRLDRPDIPLAARFRLLLEAYQLELDYGSTLEAWRAPLNLGEEELSVEYLRIGRTALYYQSLDGAHAGYWDRQQRDWLPLGAEHSRDLARALRVARNQAAPQLLALPMQAAPMQATGEGM